MSIRSLIPKPAARIALAYFGLATLWILASDSVLELVMGAPLDVSLAQTWKGLLFVAFTSLLLYLLLLRRRPVSGERRGLAIATPHAWAPIATFALFAVGLVATGTFLFHVQRGHLRANSEAQLKTVGELRGEQIRDWLETARNNARHFGRAPELAAEFAAWLAAGGKDQAREKRMLQHLRLLREVYGYADVALFDRQGNPRLSEPPSPQLAEYRNDALHAMASGRATLVDFDQQGGAGQPMLGMVAPLLASDGRGTRTVGALYFSFPARQSLFALLSRWPTPSASGETVLLRREADAIRILYASRQADSSGLAPRLPLTHSNLAAVRIAKGERGILAGAIDYRQQPVLAYSQPIPDTPWILVAKLAQSEVDAPVERLARGTALVSGLLLLAAGLAFWLWWRDQVTRQRARLLSKELERQMLATRYDTLSRYASDVILLTDDDGVILEANERVEQLYGYSRAELLGQPSWMLLPPERRDECFQQRRAETPTPGLLRFEAEHQRKDGSRFPVEVNAHVIELHGLRHGHLTIRDISERRQAEQALQEREALYRGVIETSADGFWITDLEGRLLEVNDAYCGRSGYRREELLGMRSADLDIEENPEVVTRHADKVIRTGSDLFESRHRTKDGTVWQVEVNTSYSPLRDGRLFVFLRDINRRNRSEALLRTRVQLSELALRGSLDELMQAALDAAELHTGSQIGFFHFVDADQETLTPRAWSGNTLKNRCTAEGKALHYPLSQAGAWADCVRERRVLIHNDYADLPCRKGMPEGDAQVVRELVVPIVRDDKVVAVLGVGNKTTDYHQEDAEAVEQIAAMLMDVVARKRAEDALAESNAHLLESQRIARLGNWEYDLQADRVTWSEQVYAITGIDPAQGPPAFAEHRRLFHPDDIALFEHDVGQALRDGTPFLHEQRVVRPDGEIRHIWASGQAVKDAEGKVVRLYGTIQDISERKQAEARLELALHNDPLTGLPNARWLLERLQQSMTLATAEQGRLALLVLNIDRFAQLNESLGRAAGDQVLIALAQRWTAALPDTALLARLDADQFAVLLRDNRALTQEKPDAMVATIETANDLLTRMGQPIRVGDGQATVALTLSIGISLYPGDADDAAALLHAAEDAMRIAKAERGNQACFFDRRQAQAAIDWFETETALRQALARDELFLVYQPQMDAASGRVVAAESLIRWRHDGEVVPPGRFIHVVEGTDLAEPVSRWVLQTACTQARHWLERNRPLRVAVNIFSDHVTSGHLLDDVRHALANSGLPPALLELELVESSLLKNPETAAHTLREIKRLGVGLALDDFGTGYSSLGYLKHYPFDVLKIDQLFARNVTRDPEDAAIVRSTIALAHNLGMRVLAEGVETEPQLRFMTRYGCDQIQGYLTCRPTTPEAVETLVMERRDLRPVGLSQTLPRPSVLIVENEPSEAKLLTLLLRDAGYATHIAADLDGALAVMGRERIDLIIADHYLTRNTGVEVLERLRRLFPDVPRIMVSGADEQAVVAEAVNRGGIRAFLRKPVDAEVLLRTLRKLLDESARA